MAIVAGLGIATIAYGSLEKHVIVQVEGRPVSVRTFASSVGDALARAGIRVGPRDRVLPGTSAGIRSGSLIQVHRAKEITLLLDGKPRRVIVTGLTIDEVLDEIALRGNVADLVRPSRASRVRSGMTISYRRASILTVFHDDKADRVVTNARTVGALVRELGIDLGPQDRLEPPGASLLRSGLRVRVVRIGLRREVREVRVPFKTVLRRDRHMEYGRRKQVQVGRPGVHRVLYMSKYVDGDRVSRRLLSVKIVREPRARVIAIGSSFPGCVCDNGTQTGKATWYSQADGLSAAHRTLPKGTVVHVKNLSNGRSVNVVIRDRGPYGNDRIIDLSDEAFRRIASLGTGVVRVRIWW